MPKRHQDWPIRLDRFVSFAQDNPFEWGVNDCCLFGANWVRECTGVDPAYEFRNTYKTRKAAEEILKAHGGIAALVGSQLTPQGFVPQDVPFACRGDIVIWEGCVGVCYGAHSLFLGRKRSNVWTPTLESTHSWRIA